MLRSRVSEASEVFMNADQRLKADIAREIDSLRRELTAQTVPRDVEAIFRRLEPLSIGLTQKAVILLRGARMFRIRQLGSEPAHIRDVGAPPSGVTPIQRLNDTGQSILYLADSPDTAFAEARSTAGEFCLSEWRVTAEKPGTANGGLSPEMLRGAKDIYEGDTPPAPPNEIDELISKFFRQIYTLDVGSNTALYRWCIGCGMANGFSHTFDRKATELPNGTTRWDGQFPFGAIVYPSVRKNRQSLNYALNSHGQSYVELINLQWVQRFPDGHLVGLDFADQWDTDGNVTWQQRPAHFQLKPGESAKMTKMTKVTETSWRYETTDGSIPWFV
jgi:hypothetical protein